MIKITINTKKIPLSFNFKNINNSENGATTCFLGVVRADKHPKPIKSLFYDAYLKMAKHQLNQIAIKAKAKYNIDTIIIQHRLGEVMLGQASLSLVINAPHRQDAFLAMQYVIDSLKSTVPIWKKEIYSDSSSRWVV